MTSFHYVICEHAISMRLGVVIGDIIDGVNGEDINSSINIPELEIKMRVVCRRAENVANRGCYNCLVCLIWLHLHTCSENGALSATVTTVYMQGRHV
jgi:hypothetical protein